MANFFVVLSRHLPADAAVAGHLINLPLVSRQGVASAVAARLVTKARVAKRVKARRIGILL